jgi:hypothetical protein
MLSVYVERPLSGVAYITPPALKPRKIFSFVSGDDTAKLSIWAKGTSGPAEFSLDRW